MVWYAWTRIGPDGTERTSVEGYKHDYQIICPDNSPIQSEYLRSQHEATNPQRAGLTLLLAVAVFVFSQKSPERECPGASVPNPYTVAGTGCADATVVCSTHVATVGCEPQVS